MEFVNWNPAYSYSMLPEEYEGTDLPEHWIKMLEQVNPEEGLPYFHDIYYTNITVRNAKQIFNIIGSEESPMRNFHISCLNTEGETAGRVSHAENRVVRDTQITTSDGQTVKIEDSENIHWPGVQ